MIAENDEEEWLRGMYGLFVGREEKVGRVRSVCFCQINACGAIPRESGGGCGGIPARFARDDGFGDINLCLWFKETPSLRRCDTWWISERGATDRLCAKKKKKKKTIA